MVYFRDACLGILSHFLLDSCFSFSSVFLFHGNGFFFKQLPQMFSFSISFMCKLFKFSGDGCHKTASFWQQSPNKRLKFVLNGYFLMCIVPRISHFYENRSVPLKCTGGCGMGPDDYSSLCLEGILLIHHRLFPEDLCFSLIFITELICMRTGSLFRRDSLDPDVWFMRSHNLIWDIAFGCGKMVMMAKKGLWLVQGMSTCSRLDSSKKPLVSMQVYLV